MSISLLTPSWSDDDELLLLLNGKTVFSKPSITVVLADGSLLETGTRIPELVQDANVLYLSWELDSETIVLEVQTTQHGVTYCAHVNAAQHLAVRSIQVSWYANDMGSARYVSIPYDNDDWVRYRCDPVSRCRESYDVGFLLDDQGCCAIGSLQHDVWKTAVIACAESVTTICGYTSALTRDSLPHNPVCATTVYSAIVAVMWQPSYHSAFSQFIECCTQYRPMLAWNGRVPFGWNSFAAFPDNVDLDKFKAAADFFAQQRFTDDYFGGNCFINFDYVSELTDSELQEAVTYCRERGLKAGFYCAPFAIWNDEARFDSIVNEDAGTTLRQLLLCDSNGLALPAVDNLRALDPTHPEVLSKITRHVQRHVDAGFSYIKIDFLAHAAMEGCYFNKQIETGRQAYNYGMSYINRLTAGQGLFVSASIAPVFPHGYAHARRICCDCFGTATDSEYAMNSLSWAYPMHNALYAYNDPDHVVLLRSFKHGDTTFNEAQMRIVASIISGTVMMFSDDYSCSEVQQRASYLLQQDDLLKLIAIGQSFEPVAMPEGHNAANAFTLATDTCSYMAMFNFSASPVVYRQSTSALLATDLFSGHVEQLAGVLVSRLLPQQATIVKLN